MEKDIGVLIEPGVVALMDAVVIQDHMNLSFNGNLSNHPVHEIQELHSSLEFCALSMDQSGCKEGKGS